MTLLTLYALFATLLCTGKFLPAYYAKWGLHPESASPDVHIVVTSFVNVWLNTYLAVPLLQV